MARGGPVPKDPSVRINRAVPQRGEWVTVPAFHDGPVPKLPNRRRGTGPWSAATLRAWASWWKDGASTQWSSADTESLVQLAHLWQLVDEGEMKWAAESRLRMDGLGLTQKGKRDLRLKLGDVAPVVTVSAAEVGSLEDRRALRRKSLLSEE